MAVPTATYRLQISPDFDLFAAADLVDYLAQLGISHLYSSPLLQAISGSSHGYDTVRFDQVDADRGGESGWDALQSALESHGLGLIVDIVPNHCGASVPSENPAWWSVLKYGQQSPFAPWFDIDWSGGKVVLPLLDSPDDLTSAGIESTVDGLVLVCAGQRLPISPESESFAENGLTDDLLAAQHYCLVDKNDITKVNYRRFFINPSLPALRMEEPAVLQATHELIAQWSRDGLVDGVRIDHLAGLHKPTEYLQQLTAMLADGAWIVVERTASPEDPIPESWPCRALTGIDSMREVCGLFIDPSSQDRFVALEREFGSQDSSDEVYQVKHRIATEVLHGEVARIARSVSSIVDYSMAMNALVEIASCYPIERSYLPDGVQFLTEAIAQASTRRPDLGPSFQRLFPLLSTPDSDAALRFQQLCSAVTGYAIDHIICFRRGRLGVLSEFPENLNIGSIAEFHDFCKKRQQYWPETMSTLSTHDTTRSEDVRARMSVLSEIPDQWTKTVRRWQKIAPIPDLRFGHLLWQSIVAAWPISRERLHLFAEIAVRKGGERTSWEHPNREFEASIHTVIDAVYDKDDLRADIEKFVAEITPFGWSNSLGQKLIQLTMPGVPDIYQGAELWDYSLIDPDNRRPVDFALRRELLQKIDSIDSGRLPEIDATGVAKLFVVAKALRLRRDRPELFTGYSPLLVNGPMANHVVAFNRGGAVSVAIRLPVGLQRAGGWEKTRVDLPAGQWRDEFSGASFSGGSVELAELLGQFPVSLLIRAD